jgi:hypothetical protein
MWIYFSSAVLLYAAGCARALEEDRIRRHALKPGAQADASDRRWANNSASTATQLPASSKPRP